MSDRTFLGRWTRRLAPMAGGLAIVLASSLAPPAHAALRSTPSATVGFDGPVYAIARSADRIYLGGAFSHVATTTPFGVGLSKTTGAVKQGYARPNGIVRAVVADGAGGFYIGGDFTGVGGAARHRIAHITPAGAVDAFDPDVNGPVYALALSGDTLYAGGKFTTVNGDKTRNRLAAFKTDTGTATAFDPGVNPVPSSYVTSLLVSGKTVFAGGPFTTLTDDNVRFHLASFDAATGAVTAFNPNVRDPDRAAGTVDAMALSGGVLYAAGTFNKVNGEVPRNNVAGFDPVTGKVTSFDPGLGASAAATSLALSGTTLYVGGQGYLRAYDTTKATGNATPFSLDFPGRVRALTLSGSTLYASGRFDSAGGRANMAAFDTTQATPTVTAFTPQVSAEVYATAVAGDTLYAGGPFQFAGSVPLARHNLAVLDAATGLPTAVDPDVNGTVSALALSGGTLFAGGAFTTVNHGLARKNLAAFDTATGVATAFDPDIRCREDEGYGFVRECPSAVYALAVSGDTVFAGGKFSGPRNVHNTTWRLNLASFDATTGIPRGFNPHVEGAVRALAVSGNTVYAGGDFAGRASVNQGKDRDHLAAFDAGDGTATPFDPRTDRTVRALALSGTTLYAGGDFTTVNNGTKRRTTLAAFDTATGTATAFKPEPSGPVNALALSNGRLYAGGSFTNVNDNNVLRYSLAGFDTANGRATPFDPSFDGPVFALDRADGKALYAAGAFSAAGVNPVGSFARFADRSSVQSSGIPSKSARMRTTGARLLARRRGVRVTWRTGSVSATAGFQVTRYRRVRGKVRPVRVTRRLIRVRGVRTGYAFTDRRGRRGDAYTITSVGRDGRRTVSPRIAVRV